MQEHPEGRKHQTERTNRECVEKDAIEQPRDSCARIARLAFEASSRPTLDIGVRHASTIFLGVSRR